MDNKEFEKKVRHFDRKLLQILFNVFVSVITTLLILHAAGVVP